MPMGVKKVIEKIKPIKCAEVAPCGFCPIYGQKFKDYASNICFDCEIRRIRECLEEITHRNKFEHDHKYRKDEEEQVNNCAHCEHGFIYYARYPSEMWEADNGIWCDLDEQAPEDPTVPPHKPSDRCDKWQRATDKTIKSPVSNKPETGDF
jgi:hypothetical protein